MRARSRAITPATFPASPPSWRRTCRAPRARGRRASSARSRPRTAPRSPPSCRGEWWARCSTKRPRRCSTRPRCFISAPPTTARASASRAKTPRSRPSTTRSRRRRPSAGSRPAIPPADTATCTRKPRAQYDVVSGYSGTAEIALAMERHELDGVCGWDWASFKSQRPDWIRDNKVNLLLQVGLEPNEELTRMGVPSVFKYVANEADRKAVELIISQQVFQRSYIAPPGLPAELLDTLRSAFDATMRDKDFLHDAETMRIDISPLSGAKVQELVQKIYAAPKDIVARARQAINP